MEILDKNDITISRVQEWTWRVRLIEWIILNVDEPRLVPSPLGLSQAWSVNKRDERRRIKASPYGRSAQQKKRETGLFSQARKSKSMVSEVLLKKVSKSWTDRFYQVKEKTKILQKRSTGIFLIYTTWTKEPKLTWASACFFISASCANRAARVASTLRLKSGAISY